jgi:hypothetical protein
MDRAGLSTITDEAWLSEGSEQEAPVRIPVMKLLWFADSRGYVEVRGIPYDWERFGI